MNKKKLIIAVAVVAALAVAALIAVILLKNSAAVPDSEIKTYDTIEEAKEHADFDLVYTDRLAGYPETGYSSNGSTIEITYGSAGTVRKTCAPGSGREAGKEYGEVTEREIDGIPVTFIGTDGKIYFAAWTANDFVYTISLTADTGGVSAEEMTDYVKATK